MKVGIVTFHNGSNYGAALQALALQEAVKKLGNEVQIINYDNRFISKGLDRIRFSPSVLGIYNCIFDIIHFFSNGRKIARFKSFFETYYNLTELLNAESLKMQNLGFDLGISGSDQIWNPLLNNGLDDIYFLRFGNFPKKISYASSIGAYKFNNSVLNDQLKFLLEDFDKVSTREKGDDLAHVIEKKVYDVCDPTLLLDKNDWSKLFKINERNGGYLLVYALADFNNVIHTSKVLASQRGLKIKYIGKPIGYYSGIDYVLDAGPKDFVELFINANYIVTNSFHGTAFSVNFEKQFINIKHPKSPERAASFLNAIGLSNRIVHAKEEPTMKDISEGEYKVIIGKLNNIRKFSYKYLSEAYDKQ